MSKSKSIPYEYWKELEKARKIKDPKKRDERLEYLKAKYLEGKSDSEAKRIGKARSDYYYHKVKEHLRKTAKPGSKLAQQQKQIILEKTNNEKALPTRNIQQIQNNELSDIIELKRTANTITYNLYQQNLEQIQRYEESYRNAKSFLAQYDNPETRKRIKQLSVLSREEREQFFKDLERARAFVKEYEQNKDKLTKYKDFNSKLYKDYNKYLYSRMLWNYEAIKEKKAKEHLKNILSQGGLKSFALIWSSGIMSGKDPFNLKSLYYLGSAKLGFMDEEKAVNKVVDLKYDILKEVELKQKEGYVGQVKFLASSPMMQSAYVLTGSYALGRVGAWLYGKAPALAVKYNRILGAGFTSMAAIDISKDIYAKKYADAFSKAGSYALMAPIAYSGFKSGFSSTKIVPSNLEEGGKVYTITNKHSNQYQLTGFSRTYQKITYGTLDPYKKTFVVYDDKAFIGFASKNNNIITYDILLRDAKGVSRIKGMKYILAEKLGTAKRYVKINDYALKEVGKYKSYESWDAHYSEHYGSKKASIKTSPEKTLLFTKSGEKYDITIGRILTDKGRFEIKNIHLRDLGKETVTLSKGKTMTTTTKTKEDVSSIVATVSESAVKKHTLDVKPSVNYKGISPVKVKESQDNVMRSNISLTANTELLKLKLDNKILFRNITLTHNKQINKSKNKQETLKSNSLQIMNIGRVSLRNVEISQKLRLKTMLKIKLKELQKLKQKQIFREVTPLSLDFSLYSRYMKLTSPKFISLSLPKKRASLLLEKKSKSKKKKKDKKFLPHWSWADIIKYEVRTGKKVKQPEPKPEIMKAFKKHLLKTGMTYNLPLRYRKRWKL